MNNVLQSLDEAGCDIDAALKRTLDDEEFLLDCIEMVVKDPGFDELGKQVRAQRPKEAFEAAHSLKGICANTGPVPLNDVLHGIVEKLRVGECDGLEPQYEALMEKRAVIEGMLDR